MGTYRSDVVGSLLRPEYLVQGRRHLEAGRLSPDAFKGLEDRAVDEAITLQEAAGLDVITDGELRRYAYYGHFVEAVEGFDKFGGWAIAFRDEAGGELLHPRPVVVGKLRPRRSLCAEEFTYLRARATRPTKVTLISAQQAAAWYEPERSVEAYPTREAYLADVVDILRREVAELARLGCTYIQIDGPLYSGLLDPRQRQGYRERGSDPDRLMETCLEMDNAVIAGHPGITFGLHVCRGNNQSMFLASGGYEPIAAGLFRKARFQRFLLEYDDERSGTFEPLRLVPEDRTVVLGLVTTKRPRLESPEALRARIAEAARYIPLGRLAISPQCGFASTMEGTRISPDDQRRKLEVVVRTARAVWGG
ncbi:MAG TPA: cobalamin-independent methionine synthase II family protein [Candidatus Methylomirabilis sp.]